MYERTETLRIELQIAIITLISLLLCVIQKHGQALQRQFAFRVIFLFYFFLVLDITVLRRVHNTIDDVSMIPFVNYYAMIMGGWNGLGRYIARALLGNVILFMPLGQILADTLRCKHKALYIGMIAFFCSLAIEYIQHYYAMGTFEVDDLIHNTWGAVIGWCLYDIICYWSGWKTAIKQSIPVEIFLGLLGIASLISILFS